VHERSGAVHAAHEEAGFELVDGAAHRAARRREAGHEVVLAGQSRAVRQLGDLALEGGHDLTHAVTLRSTGEPAGQGGWPAGERSDLDASDATAGITAGISPGTTAGISADGVRNRPHTRRVETC